MTLAVYKAGISKPLRLGTVTFLLREQEVLLGLKKRGFGAGNYVGIGGKVEEAKDRTTKEQDVLSVAKNGAVREIEEEIGVQIAPEHLQPMGVLRFYFPQVRDESWNQIVYVFHLKIQRVGRHEKRQQVPAPTPRGCGRTGRVSL